MHADVRFAVRMFRKSPGFTVLVLTALTLGIGATTAIFSVVRSVLLRPLPFPDPGRLVMVWERPPEREHRNVVQTQNFLDWRSRNRSFEAIAAVHSIPMNLSGEGEPVQVPGLRVSAGFFEILGVPPVIGRAISERDDIGGAPVTVVLSYGLWQRRFGGALDALGRKIMVNGSSAEVVGVMPPGFAFPTQAADLFIPMRIDRASAPRDGRNYQTIARLRQGVSLRAAQGDMDTIAAQTARERPDMNAKWGVTVVPLMEQTVGDTRQTLLVLFGAVALVLLVACANVSNLLLMRASGRRREITVRLALGAGRWRLLRQLVVESSLLAALGGALGFFVAWVGVPAILGMLPADFPLPRMSEINVDRGVFLFTLALSLTCGVFFGVFPALHVDTARMGAALREGGRHGTSAGRLLRNGLVVAEVALAMLLVIGGGLMLRSFLLLHDVAPGFRADHVLTVRMLLNVSKYGGNLQRRAAVIQDMLTRLRSMPQVSSAASIHLLPMTGMQSGSWYVRTDRPEPPAGTDRGGDVSVISDGYFHTMGIPILAGRDFDSRDRFGSPGVAILNETAARQIFPGENPIGKRLRVWWSFVREAEIVGVAADIRHSTLEMPPDPCLFLSNDQTPSLFASLVIRTNGAPAAAAAAVKAQMLAVDPDQGARAIEPLATIVSDSLAQPRMRAAVLGGFGLLGLILACVGIYAVISYSVEQRTREMGIRVALGAAPRAILRLVFGEGLLLTAIGVAVGLAGALALTRYLETLLFAIKRTDLSVYAAVTAVLVAAAVAGCYFPARRATRVHPAVVLREE
jgi:putative ABC transport system permease protein